MPPVRDGEAALAGTPTAAGPWSSSGHRRRSSIRGAAWSLTSTALSLALGLPLTALLTRLLTPAAFGRLSVSVALTTIVATLSGLGLAKAVARTEARRAATIDHGAPGGDPSGAPGDAGGGIVHGSLRLARYGCLAGTALVGVLLLGSLSSSYLASIAPILAVLLPIVVLAPFREVLAGFTQVFYRPAIAAGSDVALTAVALGGTVALLAVGIRDPVGLAGPRSLAAACAAAVLVFGVGRRLAAREQRSEQDRELLRLGLAVLVTTAAAIAISQLDIVLMGVAHGSSVAGVYTPITRLFDFVATLFAALGGYALAALTTAAHGSRSTLAQEYHWYSWLTLVVLTPVLGGLIVAPGPVVDLLFGHDVALLTTTARVFAGGMLVHVLLGYNGLLLIALGDEKAVLVQGFGALAVCVVACVILVPLYGPIGGAVSTVAGLTVSNVVCSVSLYVRHRIGPLDRRLAGGVVGAAAGLAVGAGLAHVVGGLGLSVLAGLVTMVGVLCGGLLATPERGLVGRRAW